MTEEAKLEIKRLSKEKNKEVTEFRIVEAIKITKKITRVETSLYFVLLILNVTALAVWYSSDISVATFLICYIIFGGFINVASIIIHNKWENKYINNKASYINTEISFIKMNYDAKIKNLLDEET
jgi:hypothetical protein